MSRLHFIGNYNCLTKWLCENGCFLKKGEPAGPDGKKREETHLLLNGGRLCVPDSLADAFFREYICAMWRDDAWLYVIEKKTSPIFRMLAELDLCVYDRELSPAWIEEHIIRDVFVHITDMLYPQNSYKIVYCTADVKVTEEEYKPAATVVIAGLGSAAATSESEAILGPKPVVDSEKTTSAIDALRVSYPDSDDSDGPVAGVATLFSSNTASPLQPSPTAAVTEEGQEQQEPELSAEGIVAASKAVIATATTATKPVEQVPAPKRMVKKYKYGIHLIWPDLGVNLAIARKLRACFLNYIYEQAYDPNTPLGELDLVENWSAVLDPAVFDKNGLRMIWSRKARVCPDCKGISHQIMIDERTERKRAKRAGGSFTTRDEVIQRPSIQPCHTCHNNGKIDEGRPYHITGIASGRGAEVDKADYEAVKRDVYSQIRIASIRATPDLGLELCVPNVSADLAKKIAPLEKIKNMRAIREGAKQDDDCATFPPRHSVKRPAGSKQVNSALVDVDANEDAYKVINDFTMQCLHCVMTGLKTDVDRHMYILNTSSHACRNKSSDHNSSTVYYLLYPDCMYQRCWCKKESAWKPGGKPCSEYKSSPIPYEPRFVNQIRGLFSKRFAAKFPPISKVLAVLGNFGFRTEISSSMSPAPQLDRSMASQGGDSSLGMQEGIPYSSQSVNDYDPEMRDATSFDEAEKIIAQRKVAREMAKAALEKEKKK